MGEIIDYIKRIDVIFGLVLIVAGILAGVFKQYWFIGGVNTMSKKELAKVDMAYVTKFCGIWFCILGLFMVLSPFLFDYFKVKHGHRNLIMPIVIFSIVGFIVLNLNVFNKKRVYKTGQPQPINASTKIGGIICLITIVAVGLIIYFAYKEPKVKIDANTFKLIGLHGVNLPFTEIVTADTIVWSNMPAIKRIYGISLDKVHRGKFRVNGKTVHLSIHSGVSPVIRLVKQDGSVYYINRKNATETRQIFKKLNIHN